MFQVVTVPCLRDNLSYLIVNRDQCSALIIDPSEARPFLRTIEGFEAEIGTTLHVEAILATHHHSDHIGGLSSLQAELQKKAERFSIVSRTNKPPVFVQSFRSDRHYQIAGISLDICEIPGHTKEHLAFIISGREFQSHEERTHVFLGDTLFSYGCGRCFNGTPKELFFSIEKLKRLPPMSLLHFGHEYTKTNIAFWRWALERFPERARQIVDLAHLQEAEKIISEEGFCFQPAPFLRDELEHNPFLRMTSEGEFTFWRGQRDQF